MIPTLLVSALALSSIPIGSTVTVCTTSGERFAAVLYVVDDTAITVKPKTRVAEPLRRLTFDQLEDVTLRRDRVNLVKYVVVGAAIGGAFFLGLLAAAAAGG
jgi:hypothetical protein